MRRTIVLTTILGCLLVGAASAQEPDIAKVIPEKALVALVCRNPQAFEDHVAQIAAKLADEAPPKGFMLDEMLGEARLHRRRMVDGPDGNRVEVVLPTTLDRAKPMALVVVAPDMEEKGEPVAAVVNVSDYRKFLTEVAEIAGAAAPEVTPDGTDVLRGMGRPTYCLQMGDFAVVSRSEFVIKAFKAGAQRTLAGGSVAAFKDAYEKTDLAVYVNLDEVLRTFAFQINAAKMMMTQAMMEGDAEEMPFPPQKMAKMVTAYIDTGVKLGREIDALVAGVNLGEAGVQGAVTLQAVPDTAVAKIAAGFKAAPLDLLKFGEGPFMLAAACNVQQPAVDEAMKMVTDLLKQMELFGDAAQNEKALALVKQICGASTGRMAVFMPPPEAGKPMLRGVSVADLKPGANILEANREYARLAAGIFSDVKNVPLSVAMEMQAGVETHRDVPIDRMNLTFRFNEEMVGPDGAMAKTILEVIYGNPMVLNYAVVKDRMIQAMGDPDGAQIKAMIDRLLDGKQGNVEQSPTFVAALRGLPAERAGVVVVGLADAIKGVIGTGITGQADVGRAVAAIQFARPSGVGVTVGPAASGCVVGFNVPMQEMLNIKQVITTMMQVMMQNMFRQ